MRKTTMKWYRLRKRILVLAAAIPVLQTTTCAVDDFVAQIGQQIGFSLFNAVVGSVNAVLLQSFPSADAIQVLLGGNRQPFFAG